MDSVTTTSSATLQAAMTDISSGAVDVALRMIVSLLVGFWPIFAILAGLAVLSLVFRLVIMEVSARRGWNVFWFWGD